VFLNKSRTKGKSLSNVTLPRSDQAWKGSHAPAHHLFLLPLLWPEAALCICRIVRLPAIRQRNDVLTILNVAIECLQGVSAPNSAQKDAIYSSLQSLQGAIPSAFFPIQLLSIYPTIQAIYE
jgi:hypothetical protein